jgi:putative spermidine/putrescine transport system ATP-binding protein
VSRPLELVGLRKEFGPVVVAVDGVDLRAEPGEFITLLGPSGSGKTTILRLIAGFEAPTAGRVLLAGEDVSTLSPAKRGVGFVFQHYALFPHMSVADNVGYPLRMRRVGKAERRQRVGRALELVQLEGLEERLPRELSGGQQQRVAFARALVFDPGVLLMDEPLGALDRGLRIELQDELRRVHRETGVTVLYVTHDQEEALVLSDRIGVLRDGKLLQEGAPRELFERPRDEFIARFFGECNLLADGTAGTIVVRPASLHIGSPNGASATVVTIRGVVEDLIFLGATMRVACRSEGLGRLLADAPVRAAAGLAPGDSITLWYDPAEATSLPG